MAKLCTHIVQTLTPQNNALLAKREQLQQQITNTIKLIKWDSAKYQAFLQQIGYLVPKTCSL
ncbi:hypothetical protein ACOBV9_22690 (plasmid) [Pseudoalteromonas espejiana]